MSSPLIVGMDRDHCLGVIVIYVERSIRVRTDGDKMGATSADS